MTTKTARDVMVRLQDYPHARHTQTLGEAARMLTSQAIDTGELRSMPRVLLVFDDDDQLLGCVRRRDILRGIEPEFEGALDTTHPEAHGQPEIDPNLADLVPTLDPGWLAPRLARPLGDVVHELRAQVEAGDSLTRVARALVGEDTHIAVVLDEGNVVGVVRTLDVLRAVCAALAE